MYYVVASKCLLYRYTRFVRVFHACRGGRVSRARCCRVRGNPRPPPPACKQTIATRKLY